jgi:hypothetical protein
VGPNGPAPQMAQAEARQLQIWLTPHGFVKGALDSGNATLKTDGANVVTFTALGKYKVSGTIDSQNMVTKVETTVADPVLGDLPIVTAYADYKDFNGVKFPPRLCRPRVNSRSGNSPSPAFSRMRRPTFLFLMWCSRPPFRR